MFFAMTAQGVTPAAPESRHVYVSFHPRWAELQTQSDPAGGHPGRVVGGFLVGLEGVVGLETRSGVACYLITQTSVGLLLLQSTTCSRTNVEPASRWARGLTFWADSEAKVATAPSGIMKRRKEGFSMFSLLSGVGVALLMIFVRRSFFRLMSWIVSFVSSPVIFSFVSNPVSAPVPFSST